jgi:outer membrane scaffolding protein for murein synthesis (MipA/OmpV family)
MHITRGLTAALLLIGFLLPHHALCEEKPLWEVGAGLAFLRLPDYRGSDESRIYFLPYPYVIYRGDILKVDKERISGRIFKTDRVLLDVSIFGSVPVDSSKNEARRGMPDLDPTFEIGPSLDLTLLENKKDQYKLKVTLPVRAVFATDFSSVHHEGWLFSPRLHFEKDNIIAGSGVTLGISAGPMFGSSDYHTYYYSVDPAYATPSRPAYSARGGYTGSTLIVGLNKRFNQFVFHAFFSMDHLQGAVYEDSPLVKTKNSYMYGFAVSWIFLKSEKLVNAEK